MSYNVEPTKYTSQHTDNYEYDADAKAKRIVGSVTITDSLPTAGNNPIYKLHTNAGGDLVKVEKIIGATTYTKTTDVADQTITLVVTYSAWS